MLNATRTWTRILCALALVAALALAGTLPSGKAGKGGGKGGGGGSDPPPEINFTIKLLGTLGGTWSIATAVNEWGDVVGCSETDETVTTSDGEIPAEEPFVYFNDTGKMHRLRDLVNADDQAYWDWIFEVPRGINSFGQICMTLNPADAGWEHYAVRITLAFDDTGVVIPGGGFVEIVAPDGSFGFDINEFGDVTGQSGDAFVYSDDFGFQDLGDLGSGYSSGEAINNFGEITGMSPNADGEFRAFRYVPGSGMQDLGIIESAETGGPFSREDFSRGSDLNDSGVVVGSATAGKQKGSPVTHAFREAGNGMEDLGGGSHSYAVSINGDGWIIGYAGETNGDFLYADAFGMVDIKSLITNLPADTVSFEVRQINDAAEICGKIWFTGGTDKPQAFLLTPNSP